MATEDEADNVAADPPRAVDAPTATGAALDPVLMGAAPDASPKPRPDEAATVARQDTRAAEQAAAAPVTDAARDTLATGPAAGAAAASDVGRPPTTGIARDVRDAPAPPARDVNATDVAFDEPDAEEPDADEPAAEALVPEPDTLLPVPTVVPAAPAVRRAPDHAEAATPRADPLLAAAPPGALVALALLWLLIVGAAPLLRLSAEAAGPALATIGADAAAWRAAQRSLAVAAAATAIATALGAALAALLLLRRTPGRRALIFLAVLPVLVPPQILALAASQAVGPSSPLLLALGAAPPLGTPNPLYGPVGIAALLGLQAAPLVLLSIAAVLRRVPAEAVMAARALGAAPAEAVRRAVWPLLLPGLLAGAGLAWVHALGNFGVASLLGLPARFITLPVLVWQRLAGAGPAALGEAASLSLMLAALALPGLALQVLAARRAALPAGRPFEPLAAGTGARIGAAALWLGLVAVLGLPLLALAAASLVPAMGVALSADTATLRHWTSAFAPGSQTLAALGNSLGLAAAAAIVLSAASVAVAVAWPARAVRAAAGASDLGYALPGACTAVAALLLALSLPGANWVYGTLGLIGFAYLARFQALALRPVAAAAARTDARLEQAARGMGAGFWRRLRVVRLPPLLPAMAAGGLLVALMAVNEVTMSALLRGPGTTTLGVLVFNLQDGGEGAQAAAVSLIALALVAALMAAATLAGRRLPPGVLPWRP